MKRYLLDTHLVYWWMTGDARLGKATQRIISKSEIIVSTASLWEMVLKNAKGKLPLPDGSITEQLETQGFVILPILARLIQQLMGFAGIQQDHLLPPTVKMTKALLQ